MNKDLYKGLEILLQYWPDSTFSTSEDDEIFLGGVKSLMSEQDIKALEAIPNWSYNELYECWMFYA